MKLWKKLKIKEEYNIRDKSRIPKILKRLEVIWEKHPDLRLLQLIGNIYPCTEHEWIDPYHIEDETFISVLEAAYSDLETFKRFGMLAKKMGRRDWK